MPWLDLHQLFVILEKCIWICIHFSTSFVDLPIRSAVLSITPSFRAQLILIHIYALLLQVFPRLLNLCHQFFVCFGYVVECEDSVAELS